MMTNTTDEADQSPTHPEATPQREQVPDIEDAYTPEVVSEQPIGEDDPELLAPESRSLEAKSDESEGTDATQPASEKVASAKATTDDTSDTAAVVDDDQGTEAAARERLSNWGAEQSAHRIAVELKRIESEVRRLLEDRDTRRKRRLAGTRRWHELEEDIIAWQFKGRFDEQTLHRLRELIAKRHYLFNRLGFVATARPARRM